MPVSPIAEVFRDCVATRKLLMSNDDGNTVKLSHRSSGTKAVREKEENVLTEAQMRQHTLQHFPNCPIMNVEDPKHRARAIKKRECPQGVWTQDASDMMAKAFLVSAGQ